MTIINKHFKISCVFFAALTISSCSKQTTLVNSEHKGYIIDQKAEVDSSVIRYYLPFKAQMEQEMNTVIGTSERELTKGSGGETLLGNFFADGLLSEGKKLDPNIQVSFGTKGGLRSNIPKGNVTVSHLFELMPFENELVVAKLDGKGMLALINFISTRGGQPIAGMTMKIKDGKASEVTIGGQPFDVTKDYSVLTYDYLSNGGDGLAFFSEAKEKNVINLKVRDALMNYVKETKREGKTINTQLDGRIVIE